MERLDIVSSLPDEIAYMIFAYLSLNEVIRFRFVCKTWHAKISESRIWIVLCRRCKFEVPSGLTPCQYRKAFFYLRERLLRLPNSVELCEVPIPGVDSAVTAVNYHRGQIIVGENFFKCSFIYLNFISMNKNL